MPTLEEQVLTQVKAAKAASVGLGLASEETRNAALLTMACALRGASERILAANAEDMAAARDAGTKESLLDRLALDESRIDGMAEGLKDLAALPDPLGRHLEERTLYNGLELTRLSVPLGVVAVVYEARPNVTADAAGICVKSGNACVLRGGSMAARSNAAIAAVLEDAAVDAGLPIGCIQYIASADRAATDVLMGLHGLVDVLIPRGGAGLINHCVEHSKVPVIETGTGNCHVYVHRSADEAMARSIVVNAKCRRYGVCNAAETLLVDDDLDDRVFGELLNDLAAQGVTIHGDERTQALGAALGIPVEAATEAEWETEYLSPDIAVASLAGPTEAIAHINRYGTHHSEAIVAADDKAIERFLNEVDAAAVYANASTAFTDGGQFGLGAEIGISTQKLHVRGPFALEALTSSKYVVRGTGQVRA